LWKALPKDDVQGRQDRESIRVFATAGRRVNKTTSGEDDDCVWNNVSRGGVQSRWRDRGRMEKMANVT
jgi:hypothetical protein